MKFLTDVKEKRFICLECHATARVVTLEEIDVAWCDTFECVNNNTMVNLDGRWEEFEHEDIFELDEIQGLLFKEVFVNSWENRVQGNSSKAARPRSHLSLVSPHIRI